MKLKNEARDRECQVRYPGICNGDRETVVLAHPNEKSVFGVGTGQKPDDIFGAHCCSACHDIYDQRHTIPNDHPAYRLNVWEIKIMFYQGIFRTQNILLEENKIIIP